MDTSHAPQWVEFTRMTTGYEEELDVRADSAALDCQKYRHRKRSAGDQPANQWEPGLAPK